MKLLKDIKKIVTKFNVKPRSEMRSKVLDEALEIQKNQSQQSTSDICTRRIIMNSKLTKFAAATVIIVAILIGVNHFGGSIDVSSVAWAEVVRRVEQSHNQYYEELLVAMEEKDAKKASSKADALSEFWQGINMLAEERLESTEDSLNVL